MINHKHPSISHCPACDVPISASSPLDETEEAPPEEGDFSICIVCAAILVYTKALELRLASREELIEALMEFPEIRRAREIIMKETH